MTIDQWRVHGAMNSVVKCNIAQLYIAKSSAMPFNVQCKVHFIAVLCSFDISLLCEQVDIHIDKNTQIHIQIQIQMQCSFDIALHCEDVDIYKYRHKYKYRYKYKCKYQYRYR